MTQELQTEVLELTAPDLFRRMNSNNDPEGWGYGPGQPYTEADVVELEQQNEEIVIDMLTPNYQRLIRTLNYHGEVIVRYATQGQTTAKLGLTPIVDGTLKVYVNYPKAPQPWITPTRDDYKLMDSEFTYDATTNVLTLATPLDQGNWVYATYDHKAGRKLRMLRRLALDLCVVQLARDSHGDTENYQMYQDINTEVFSMMKKMRERGEARVAIDLFDRLDLVIQTRQISNNISWGLGF